MTAHNSLVPAMNPLRGDFFYMLSPVKGHLDVLTRGGRVEVEDAHLKHIALVVMLFVLTGTHFS